VEGISYGPSTHTFLFKVNFNPGVEVYPENPQEYLEPGVTSDVNFILRNTGNGKDSFTLDERVDDVHIRKGWKVWISSGAVTTVDPNKISTIQVKVTVPVNAPRFYNINLFLSVVSNGPKQYQIKSETVVLFADIRYGARIEEFDEPFLVKPGKENTIMFNFTNEGNDKDPNQRLDVSYKPKDWWVYIDQTQMRARDGLGPRTMAFLEMTVFVEETTTSSEKSSALPFIVIQALGGPNPEKPYVLDEVRYYFTIPLNYKLEMTTDEPDRIGFVGGQVEYMINVRNTGNWLDTFNISVDSEWAEFEIDMSNLEIAPNETYPVKLIVEIPFDAAADTNPDTPYPHPYYNWYDGYPIKIMGYSQNESKEGESLTFLKLVVHVQPFYNFEMQVDPNEPELKFSTDHDEARAFRVELKNTGNIQDVIQLDWEDLPIEYSSWIRLQNNYVDIAFGETAYAVININPRANTIKEPGKISFNLTGTSQRDPDAQPVEVDLEIVLQFYRMQFDIFDEKLNNELINGYKNTWADTGVKLETPRRYSITVTIENIGDVNLTPVRFETLYVVLYDRGFEVDRGNITYLPSQWMRNITFLWKSVVPGPHDFIVAIEGDVPVSDRGVTEKAFTIEVRAPPIWEEPPEPEVPLAGVIIPLILIVIFAAAAFIFISKYNQIYISSVETGYDESGEYRPWAVKEKLKGEPEQLSKPAEKPALPPQEKPALPAAPGSVPQPVSAGPIQPAPARAPPRPPMPAQPRPVAQAPPRPPMPAQPRPVAQAPPRPPMPAQPKHAAQPPKPPQNQ
ncbi:MAG: hypothetical protein U9R75_12670, partial [Candidatus Thermoplasmatota archaeon]|nr:hypothetical protein [Candidatus Thermoplasmatota archaeon]